MLQVAIRFRSLTPRQGIRMGMLGVATGTQLVGILYAPSMQGDGSSQPHVTGKIPYALAEWVRGHLRERSHHASVIVDVLQTCAKIRNAGRKAPEATTMKRDLDRTHVGR